MERTTPKGLTVKITSLKFAFVKTLLTCMAYR